MRSRREMMGVQSQELKDGASISQPLLYAIAVLSEGGISASGKRRSELLYPVDGDPFISDAILREFLKSVTL